MHEVLVLYWWQLEDTDVRTEYGALMLDPTLAIKKVWESAQKKIIYKLFT